MIQSPAETAVAELKVRVVLEFEITVPKRPNAFPVMTTKLEPA
jgi:hypothetical protein